MIKKINIIFLLIISFSFCSSVFAKKKIVGDLIEKCRENIDLPECEEIPPLLLCEGSPNAQHVADTIEDDSPCFFGITNKGGYEN